MELVEEFASEFRAFANPDDAPEMERYMKGQFPFLGIKRPIRQKTIKPYSQSISSSQELFDFVHGLWELEEREYQYAAMDVLQNRLKLIGREELPYIKELVRSKSWWDTVDRLSASITGPAIVDDHKAREIVFSWKDEGYLWLDRCALLFQLKYKLETNKEMLAEVLRQFSSSSEFFHQKAIGWALRNYSKSNREWVKGFIDENQLKPLSIREGSKYL